MSYRLTKAVVEKIASGHGRFRAVAGITLAALGVLALIGSANAQPVSPALPVINTNNMVNILNQGAVGDGVTTNTTAIQNAINAAAGGEAVAASRVCADGEAESVVMPHRHIEVVDGKDRRYAFHGISLADDRLAQISPCHESSQ